MNIFNAMKTFIIVASEKSFSSAGKKLGVSKVQISRDVAKLEEHLGVKLFHRNTRSLNLSSIGEIYFEQASHILNQITDLHQSIHEHSEDPIGKIRILAPNALAEMFLVPIFTNFRQKHPNISIELKLSHSVFDLIGEGFDLAIRTGKLLDSNLICRHIAQYDVVTCASPTYLQKHGYPKKPQDLLSHQIILDPIIDDSCSWKFKKNNDIEVVKFKNYLSIDSAQAVRKTLLLNLGIGIVPLFAVADDIKEGKLINLFSDFELGIRNAYVLYPNREYIPHNVTLFLNELLNLPNKKLSVLSLTES